VKHIFWLNAKSLEVILLDGEAQAYSCAISADIIIKMFVTIFPIDIYYYKTLKII
jgi:hypothetical protein